MSLLLIPALGCPTAAPQNTPKPHEAQSVLRVGTQVAEEATSPFSRDETQDIRCLSPSPLLSWSRQFSEASAAIAMPLPHRRAKDITNLVTVAEAHENLMLGLPLQSPLQGFQPIVHHSSIEASRDWATSACATST